MKPTAKELVNLHRLDEAMVARGLDALVARAGHSVGAWWHQQDPVISGDNPRLLEDDMVIAMEPHLGYSHIQDTRVVRPSGPELISAKISTEQIFECQ